MDMIYNLFAKPFFEKHPDVDIRNICDDSLLADNLQAGSMPNDAAGRILNYIFSAERAGADAVMVTCTSVYEAAQYAGRFASAPVFNIDESMVKLALDAGKRSCKRISTGSRCHMFRTSLNEQSCFR